ncbi:MAG: hypothetical protein HUU55_17850 [Myxococcales bacterium]|nr:hypothetical protein [Myxococcales bacterium]
MKFAESKRSRSWAVVALLFLSFGRLGCADDDNAGNVSASDIETTNDTAVSTDTQSQADSSQDQDLSVPEDQTSIDTNPSDTIELDFGDTQTEQDTTDATTCEGGQKSCKDKNGLNDPSLCVDQPDTTCVLGCCVPTFKCKANADCVDFAGDSDMGCPDERFLCACQPDTGKCKQWLCVEDGDCEDEFICGNGVCISKPDVSNLKAIIVSPPAMLTPGKTVQLHADAYDYENPGIVVRGVQFEWSSTDETVATVDENGLATAQPDPLPGATMVKARVVGGHPDWSEPIFVDNMGTKKSASATRVMVTNTHWHEVVESLVVIKAANGEFVGETELGKIEFEGVEPPYDVHVFSETHQYVSIFGQALDDLLVQLPPRFFAELNVDQDGTMDPSLQEFYGEGDLFKGAPDFSLYSKLGEIEATITSFGFGDGLFEFDLPLLLGPNTKRYYDPEAPSGVFPPDEQQELPGGVTFSLGFPVVSTYYLATGNGPGPHPMWSLGGRVALSDSGVGQKIGEIVDAATSGGSINIEQIVATLFPLFKDFYSGLKWVGVKSSPMYQDSTQTNVTLQMPLANSIIVPSSPLPTVGAPDLWTDAVLVIGGILMPRQFIVPTGLTAGTDKEHIDAIADGKADGIPETPELDPFHLWIAPPHNRLQGDWAQPVVVTVAAVLDSSSKSQKPEAGSGIIHWLSSAKDTAVSAEPNDPYLPISVGSAWSAVDNRTLSVGPVEGAEFYRVVFKSEEGFEWHVYLNGDTDTVQLPNPQDYSPDYPDRTSTAKRMVVNAFKLRAGENFEELLTAGDKTLGGLLSATWKASYINNKIQ